MEKAGNDSLNDLIVNTSRSNSNVLMKVLQRLTVDQMGGASQDMRTVY